MRKPLINRMENRYSAYTEKTNFYIVDQPKSILRLIRLSQTEVLRAGSHRRVLLNDMVMILCISHTIRA